MATDNFPEIQVGGKIIDYDGLRSLLGGTIDSCTDLIHAKIVAGEQFSASHSNALMANAGTLVVAMNAGTEVNHVYPSLTASAACKVRYIEGGTLTPAAGGTLTAYNRDRNNAGTPSAEIFHGTVQTGGTVIYEDFLPGNIVGGGFIEGSGWGFMSSKETAIEVVALGAGTVCVSLGWHED